MENYDILKGYCQKIILVGSGNFWYEDGVVYDDKSTLYNVYRGLIFSIYAIMTISEIMAATIGAFPEDERRESLTFSISHTIVLFKMLYLVSKRPKIKMMNKKMVHVCAKYEEPELMAEKYKTIKWNVIAYFVIVYSTVAFYVFEGLNKLYKGPHFVVIVTYYPSFEDNSLLANICRVITTLILNMMMMTMIISVDSFTMVYLIMYKYKVITLRHYFDKLKSKFKRINKTGDFKSATKDLTYGFVEGVKMHNELLSLAKDIDGSFGMVITLQLCLSSGSAVTLLLQLALADELTFFASTKIIFFVFAVFFLLGLFLCNAGEITNQGSLLADAIFYCGWYECSPLPTLGRKLRHLVLLSCAQAQRPIVMKAFKMIDLTYATFLQVVRGTYSVFALFYAQNKQ